MSEKQEMIKKMIEMQKKFMELEHKSGVSQEEYFAAAEGHALHNYRQEYRDLAMKVVDMAHEDKGSHS